MRLFFRDFNTTQFKILYTEETQLIQDLKHDIATILEIDTLNFFLIANGKILRDDLVISDYGLRDSTFLDVNLRILGGMEGQVARVASIRRTVLEKKNTTIIKKKSSNQDNKSFTMSTRFELMQKLENQIYGRQDESKEIKLSGVKSIKFSSTTNKFFVLALPSKIHIFDENGNNEIQSFERDGIIEIEPINQPEGLLYTLETQKIELYSLKSKSVIRVIEPEIKGRYTFIAAFQIFQESSFLVGSDTELSYDQFSMVNWQSVHTYEVPKCAFEIEKRSQRSPEKVKSIFKKKQAVVKFLTGHTSAQNYQGKITVKELSHSLNNKFAIIAKDNNIYLWNIETRTYVENFAIQNIEGFSVLSLLIIRYRICRNI